LDEALVVCFEQEKSFTGEKICEFQLHGSAAVVAAVLGELGNCTELKIADAGEFTRQALENAKIDQAFLDENEIGIIYGNDSTAKSTVDSVNKIKEKGFESYITLEEGIKSTYLNYIS
jgi:tRNA U34 5-carboxymethylaminomethyl modifying GTPase MnmE/TrmE